MTSSLKTSTLGGIRSSISIAAQNIIRWDLSSLGIAFLLVSGFLAITTPAFTSAYNLTALGFTLAITGIVALAQLTVLAVGQFNLSLTAIGVLVGMLSGWLMQNAGFDYGIVIVVGILAGSLAGALQGAIIVYTGINPFIVSLAIASIYFGAVLGITRGHSFNRLPSDFVSIGREQIGPISYLLLICLLISTVTYILFERTITGRQLLATGGSRNVSNMSGINTGRMILFAHTYSGFLAAVAGVMLVARLGSAQPSLGIGWLLPSFAAPVLGGTLLSGGKVSIPGTLIGALLLAIIANGLILFNVSAYFYQTFLGIIILIALGVDRARQSYVLGKSL